MFEDLRVLNRDSWRRLIDRLESLKITGGPGIRVSRSIGGTTITSSRKSVPANGASEIGYLELVESPQPYHTIPDPLPELLEGEKLVYVTAGHVDNRLPDNYQSHFILTPGDVLYAEATLTVTDNQYHCSVLTLVVGTSSDPMFVQTGDDFTLARVRIASAHAVSGATQLTKTNKWNRTIATVGGVEQYSEGLLVQRKQVVLLIA